MAQYHVILSLMKDGAWDGVHVQKEPSQSQAVQPPTQYRVVKNSLLLVCRIKFNKEPFEVKALEYSILKIRNQFMNFFLKLLKFSIVNN